MEFEKVKKNFGFGCMRLPMKDGEVDKAEFCRMIEAFFEGGFNYFDTAHGYLNGKSEKALRECLTDRYPRESYTMTDKLTEVFFDRKEEIRPFFESQLKILNIDYFDFYLMHAQNAANYQKFKRLEAYETAFALKEEGKIRHVGLSFHDKPEVLDTILREYPEVELVQLQFNYADLYNPSVESMKCYEVARAHKKPIIVMEPVKGGMLVNLPPAADEAFRALGGSNASYAIRFAAGFEGVFMTLSGMSDLKQTLDNVSFMKEFRPLNEEELQAVRLAAEEITKKDLIACTGCRYCTAGCPKQIPIPEIFSCMNQKIRYHSKDWNSTVYYRNHTKNAGKAGDCIRCGKCEKACPQHLNIRELLQKVSKEFDGE